MNLYDIKVKHRSMHVDFRTSTFGEGLTLHLCCVHFTTAEALAGQVSEENHANGLIYPPFSSIRKISAILQLM